MSAVLNAPQFAVSVSVWACVRLQSEFFGLFREPGYDGMMEIAEGDDPPTPTIDMIADEVIAEMEEME